MSPQPPPLAGWSGWRWAGKVLIGTNPAGLEQSLGEIYANAHGMIAVLSHPARGKCLRTERVETVPYGKALVDQWVTEFSTPATAPEPEPPDPSLPFGERVRRARMAAGLTHRALGLQVAERLGRDNTAGTAATIGLVERGTHRSTPIEQALADIFGLTAPPATRRGKRRTGGGMRSEDEGAPGVEGPELEPAAEPGPETAVEGTDDGVPAPTPQADPPTPQAPQVLPGLNDTDEMRALRQRVEALERVAHPPIDLRPLVEEALRDHLRAFLDHLTRPTE